VGGLPEGDEKDSLHITEEYQVSPLLISELKRTPSLSNDRKAYRKLKELIQEFQPDIVHTHASKAGALGRRAANACKVPIVVHTFHGHVFHSYFGRAKTFVFKTIERRLARRSTGIIAISALQKIELSQDHKICQPEKIKVIPLGFDLEKFANNSAEKRKKTRSAFGIQDGDVAIAIVGRLAPVKDHDFFLQVIEKVLDQTTQSIQVFIVGDGSERQNIEEKVDQLNRLFDNKIHMTSWITDIASFNAGMDVLCLTSKNEGTPVSLIEAQAAGVPVITTDVGGVKDVVDEGNTGFVVPVGATDDYVQKLLELVEDEKKRSKMSQNGWTFVRDKFHYQRLVRDMEDYYMELLEKNKKK
jgi:glycosyltransferase involved in cell wall biosynthesis